MSSDARVARLRHRCGLALVGLQGTLQGVQGAGPLPVRHPCCGGLHEPHPAIEFPDGNVVDDRCGLVSLQGVLGSSLCHRRAEPMERLPKGDSRRWHELGHFTIEGTHPCRVDIGRPPSDRDLRREAAPAEQTAAVHPPAVAWQICQTFEDLSLIHISEPTRRTPISYAVFCLKTKKTYT